MVIKQKVKFSYKDNNGNKRFATVTISGRTTEELNGRTEKLINNKLHQGWELR